MGKGTETLKHDTEVVQFRFATDTIRWFRSFLRLQNSLKWKSQYTIGSLDALKPNRRSDKGIP